MHTVQVSNADIIRRLELLEVRLPLETSIARHAAERATPTDLEELRSLAREMTEAAAERNRDRYFRTKGTLHEVEVRAAYNHVLTQTMRSLHAQSRRFWFYEPPESFAEAAERHGAVVNQITDRNAEAAAAAVKDLFAFLQLQTKRTLDRRPTT